jgi:hypothetical protein
MDDLEQEIKEIAREEAEKTRPSIEFPEIQRVEVINPQDPVINVTTPEVRVPEIKVPTPQVTVDVDVPPIEIPENTSSNLILASIREILQNRPEASNEDILQALEAMSESLGKSFKNSLKGFQSSGWLPVVDEVQKRAGDIWPASLATTTALDDTESWNSGWVDTNGYSGIKVAVKTDQNGTFTVQWSPDGTNTDSTLTRYYRTSQIEAPHKFENMRRYVKITVNNNSGSNQTYLRVQGALTNSHGILNTPIDGTMSQDYDAISTRPTNFKYEVALGRRQGYTLWNKFGYNTDIDTATDPEIVAEFGGSFTPLTTASTLTIVSSSTDDDGDPGGTGAQTIRVIGLDANRDTAQEDFTMDGTTDVVSTSTWLGINRVIVLTSGSNDANVGKITITATTGGTTQATVPAGESVTQQLLYFNPRNHVALTDWLILSAHRFGSGTEPVITFKGWVYSPLTDTKYEVLRETLDELVATELQLNPSQPFVFAEQDVFWIEAETSRDDTNVYGRFSLIAVRDVDA